MNRNAFLLELDDILGLQAGTLQGGERLDELENWDSTTLITVIAVAEGGNESVRITPDQIVACETVADLLRIAGVHEIQP
jgi:acyl carrier protein